MGGRGSSGAGGGSGAARGLSASGVDVALVNTVGGTSAEKKQAEEALYSPIRNWNENSVPLQEMILNRQSTNPVARENVARHDYVRTDAPRRYAEKINTAFRLGQGEDNFTAKTVMESRSTWNAMFEQAVSESTAWARSHIRYSNGKIVTR